MIQTSKDRHKGPVRKYYNRIKRPVGLMAPNTKDTNNYCMHIPLNQSSSHDTRQRLQNLGHARSDISQILDCC